MSVWPHKIYSKLAIQDQLGMISQTFGNIYLINSLQINVIRFSCDSSLISMCQAFRFRVVVMVFSVLQPTISDRINMSILYRPHRNEYCLLCTRDLNV